MAVVRLGDWGTAPALRDLDSAAASGNRVFGLDRCELARPERLELPTLWFEARCSDPTELRAHAYVVYNQ